MSSCDYAFTGTGEGTSFWPWIIALILLFILIIAILLCVAALMEHRSKHHGRKTHGTDQNFDAPHVLNKRPRGVPSGPMEYDYDGRSNNFIGHERSDTYTGQERSQYRGTDQFDTRSKCVIISKS